jgi:hypothetical protein
MCASRWLRLGLLALTACGDNAQPRADAPSAIACSATFTGNYSEQSSGPSDCATLSGDGSLVLHIPVATLSATLDVSIALGASPTPGRMTSETVSAWSASVQARCTYGAGSSVVPPGNFELTLDALDPAASSAHGTLAITQYLLQFPGIPYCGPYDTELVTLTF